MIRLLDARRRPIRSSRRQPATRIRGGVTLYHYEIRVEAPSADQSQPRRQIRRRLWLPDQTAAEREERRLLGMSASGGLAWMGGFDLWTQAVGRRRAERHTHNVGADVRRLVAQIGDVPIEQTTHAQYSRWLRSIASPVAARHAYAHTMGVARWLLREGEVGAIPFAGVRSPVYRAPERRPATPQQFVEIGEALPPCHRALWLAIGYTGSRVSAMTWLRESDVGQTHVEIRPKQRRESGERVQRYLITPGLARALDEARAWKRRIQRTSEWVFVNSRGSRLTTDAHLSALGGLRRSRPDLPRITPHQLRHFAGTVWGQKFSATVVQAAMGHAQRRSSEPYTHRTQEMADEAAIELAEKLATDVTQKRRKSSSAPVSTATNSARPVVSARCPKCGTIVRLDGELRPKSR